MSFGSGNSRSGSGQLPREEKAKRQKIAAWVLGVIGGFVPFVALVGVLTFLVLYATTNVPSPDEVKQNQVATILDDQGHVISKIVPPAGNRTDVKFEDIPEPVRQAVIAAEDRDFESNSGFSISGLARAAWGQLTGNEVAGGGSTITQQYVKNSIVGDQHSYIRKFKELAISTKMANEWSKDDILGAYLNTIYYGRGAYGIASAWKAYFNEDITKQKYDQMNPAQQSALVAKAAVIASSIRSPSYYDPANNLAAAQTRWNYVLDGMVVTKYLTKEQRAQFTLAQYPKVAPPPSTDSSDPQSNGPNGLIKQQVLAELESEGISEQDVQTEGLKITTGIDPKVQAAAVKSANDNLQNDPNPDDPKSAWRTSVVSVDPRTGRIEGYFGGNDGHGYDYAQAALQAGSAFKVFALIAALEQGVPLSKVYSSAPFQAPGGTTITNSDGESCGSCNLATALKMSLNTVYYRLMMDLQGQAQAVADAAHAAGIAESFGDIPHTLQEANGSVEGGVVLGQYGVRVLDMASAYATIAASGIYRPAHFVTKVETSDGRVLYDDGSKTKGERKLPAAVADNTTAAMVPIASYSNGHGLSDPETGSSRPSAAKTGTTQLGDTGQNKDAWMVGFTPQLSTAVWVGTNGGVALKSSSGGIMYGSQTPSSIWQDAMNGALAGEEIMQFPTPTEIGGQAGVPYDAPVQTYQRSTTPRRTTEDFPGQNQLPSAVTLAPGVTIPLPGNGNGNGNQNPNQYGNGAESPNQNGNENLGPNGGGGDPNQNGNGNGRNNGEVNPVPGLGPGQ